MRTIILAAAAVLSLGVGSAFAASTGTNQGSVAATNVTAATNAQQGSPLYVGPVPNPWDGSESWRQWNNDHPSIGDGG